VSSPSHATLERDAPLPRRWPLPAKRACRALRHRAALQVRQAPCRRHLLRPGVSPLGNLRRERDVNLEREEANRGGLTCACEFEFAEGLPGGCPAKEGLWRVTSLEVQGGGSVPLCVARVGEAEVDGGAVERVRGRRGI